MRYTYKPQEQSSTEELPQKLSASFVSIIIVICIVATNHIFLQSDSDNLNSP